MKADAIVKILPTEIMDFLIAKIPVERYDSNLAFGRFNQQNVDMPVTVQIPAALRTYCDGATTLTLTADTIRAALEQIGLRYPALYRSVCDETATVRRHVNIFVNNANMRDCAGLDTVLASGDVVTILPAVSGG